MSTATDFSAYPEVAHWPRLTRFYGLSPAQLLNTPRWLRHLYIEELSVLQSEEQLAAIQASSYPHLESADQDQIFRQLAINADFSQPVPAINPTTEEGRAVAAGLGIAVVMEDA